MAKINKDKQAAVPQKVLHELFDYNSETGKWVNETNRGKRAKAGQPAGCLHKLTGYVRIKINGKQYQAHRLAWAYVYGDYPDGEQPYIDHINGKKDDNRIANLKISSGGDNMKNKEMYSSNTSGVNGVTRTEKVEPSGKIYYYWVAHWYNEKGKKRQKCFSINKLGEEVALKLAIDYRVEQIRLLEVNHGVIYSSRHGT